MINMKLVHSTDSSFVKIVDSVQFVLNLIEVILKLFLVISCVLENRIFMISFNSASQTASAARKIYYNSTDCING